ncbi:hypothetical protein F5Y17DRAFT_254923 [Xylariaceae sp. FL0594]|nr:hypothetical protein F5Y17DRAFT_254923 [Xylariaceae sp. FL0594]
MALKAPDPTDCEQPLMDGEDRAFPDLMDTNRTVLVKRTFQFSDLLKMALVVILSASGGFWARARAGWTRDCERSEATELPSTARQIPLPYVRGEFVHSSPFSLEPPRGEGHEEESEPIWDALVPNGLGYFRDGTLAPTISTPTTFHQLHCLYVLRRAYYSTAASGKLEPFDLGKNRTVHAAHCFDYLTQSITCAVDSTVEPYEGNAKADGFLGSGFPRRCRSFDALKQYVDDYRVFNATGFLAAGIVNGKAHVDHVA